MTKAERTRQFIIEKAAPIFNQKGISGTSMSDIMEATKLAKGGLYGNFESKEEICLEAYKYLSQSLSDAIELAIAGAPTAKGKLFALLGFYEQRLFIKNHAGCPILNFGTEADDTNPHIKQRVSESIDRFQNRIKRIIRAGQESGELHNDFNADTFATKMFAMIEGAILMSKVQGSANPMHTIINVLKTEIEQYCN